MKPFLSLAIYFLLLGKYFLFLGKCFYFLGNICHFPGNVLLVAKYLSLSREIIFISRGAHGFGRPFRKYTD